MKRFLFNLVLFLILLGILPDALSGFQAAPKYCRKTLFRISDHKILYQSSSDEIITDDKPYFLRKALMADLSEAARVLADGFYSEQNPASRWWEKMQTQLSLESNLPNNFLNAPHEMWVACENESGRVISFCEVDNRPPKKTGPNSTEVRPYMCNLAVDIKWRKQGIAKDMIQRCEDSVKKWEEKTLYLKVREKNDAAVSLYEKMGYVVVSNEITEKSDDILLTMKRTWPGEDEVDDDLSTAGIIADVSAD